MLNAYLSQTASLLQNPPAPNALYSTSLLTGFINSARGQLAGESESIRFAATLPLTAETRVYPFSSINLTGATGVEGVINIRTAWYSVGSGYKRLRPRPFEWFGLFELNSAVPPSGAPKVWSQYAQGVNGSIYVSPLPDTAYSLLLDTVCYPEPLASDSDPEAIPYLWTDAVPYFAAYLALLSSQTSARQADADRMFARYTEFVNRARRFATPSVMPGSYPQNPDLTLPSKLGVQQKAAAGGG